ncbi:MAG: kinase [Sphingomonadaceae bacterium]|nr:kinase [Sphingomonadaceae bacterium]
MTAAAVVAEAVARWRRESPLVVGLCGPQGAGKSIIAAALAADARVAVLGLDDLYLGPAERARLAAEVHRLLRTRGVPGTHDVALGLGVLARLKAGEAVRLPRFDKATDAPLPRAEWPLAGPADVVLFEGWCVGARPQGVLGPPINDLEAREDPDGRWRAFVDAQLAGPYQRLFAAVDRLVLLRAPDFATVVRWRQQAERDGPQAMTDAEVQCFCAHYERLTRHVAAEMPARADLVIDLAADRTVASVASRG